MARLVLALLTIFEDLFKLLAKFASPLVEVPSAARQSKPGRNQLNGCLCTWVTEAENE